MTTPKVASLAEFEAATKNLRLAKQSLNVARAVLVEQTRQTDMAVELGLSRQKVSRYVSVVWDEIVRLRAAQTPPGWSGAFVVLPEDAWPEVHAIERRWRKLMPADQSGSTESA